MNDETISKFEGKIDGLISLCTMVIAFSARDEEAQEGWLDTLDNAARQILDESTGKKKLSTQVIISR